MRILALLSLALFTGCGPHASPAQPLPGGNVVPYEVTLVAGTDPQRLEQLYAAGAVAVGEPHLRGDRYLVRMTGKVARDVHELALVVEVAPQQASRRYAAERFDGLPEPIDVVIDLFAGTDSASLIAALEDWGAKPVLSAPTTVRASITRSTLASLAAMDGVRWIEAR